jgi:anti-sigma factor RsiW
MMTCKEVLESLSGYLDEDLKQEVVVEMKKHIGLCTDCRAEFDTLTMTIKLYRHFDAPSMPADVLHAAASPRAAAGRPTEFDPRRSMGSGRPRGGTGTTPGSSVERSRCSRNAKRISPLRLRFPNAHITLVVGQNARPCSAAWVDRVRVAPTKGVGAL